ncbi:MAG: protein-methionine-sulfoxide reductase catalytic subunit MsrP [Candidatus Latescibacteria bacterium]|jgi:sulfoxide reductase catalytic subunit YedY|nr:protein-methionine-sulfoxide reductase catalytic subunit MsrP [Candidatus Latescibacterota bacterium]
MIPEREATPESVYLNRRQFLKAAGIRTLSAAALLSGCGHERVFEPFEDTGDTGTNGGGSVTPPPQPPRPLYPATVNPEFNTLDRPLTEEEAAATYNNFYEFTTTKEVHKFIDKFQWYPWAVQVAGEVEKPKTYDFDDLVGRMPLEERLYRHRCVEAWSMAVPWTGFPMKALIDEVKPLSTARFVKMTTFLRPDQAPGQFSNPQWPWPYVEGLTMAEATNELTLLGTGIYGQPFPAQHGPPVRLVVPWKYGFKCIKSIVMIEFTREQPATFWNTLVPSEYGFFANVDPQTPRPRWSQATERVLGSNERVPTLSYNGYEKYVAQLYQSTG